MSGPGGPGSQSQAPLVRPDSDFARLLKRVGAEGKRTLLGELYTIKQVCFYLKEYIKLKRLYDEKDPRIVHCHDDELAEVFGVQEFCLAEALDLVRKHTVVIDYPGQRRRHCTPPPTDQQGAAPAADQAAHQGAAQATAPPPTVDPAPSPQNGRLEAPVDQSAGPESHQEAAPANVSPGACETRSEEPQPGPSTDPSDRVDSRPKKRRKRAKSECQPGTSENVGRQRQSSISIIYSGDVDSSSCPLYVQLELEDSDETVYSIQSKETVYVKDSSDDFWFLDSDEDEALVSVEIGSTHSAPDRFTEEYEVGSNVSGHGRHDSCHGHCDGDSDSPQEEFIVIGGDSDTQFWADSESSDTELSSDEELSTGDQWLCDTCDTYNSPIVRFCSRCWSLRPDWMPDKKQWTNQIRSQSPECNKAPLTDFDNNIVMSKFLKSSWSGEVHPKDTLPEVLPIETRTRPLGSSYATSTATGPLPDPPSLSRQDTVSVSAAGDIFKVPPSADPQSRWSDTGRSLPRLSLVSDDSGVASLASSQESFITPSCAINVTAAAESPTKHRPFLSPSRPITASSPVRPILSPLRPSVSPMRLVSPPRHKRRLSPYPASPKTSKQIPYPASPKNSKPTPHPASPKPGKPTLSPYPASPKPSKPTLSPYPASPKPSRHTLFPFDRISPRQSRADHAPPPPEPPAAAKRIVFSDPLPSPKKRDPCGIPYSDLCVICLSKPKEASVIHGKKGHQVCCYVCAKRLKRSGQPCPVCRRPIQKVIKNYFM